MGKTDKKVSSFCFLIRLVDLINSIFFLDFSVQDATLTLKNENSTRKETKIEYLPLFVFLFSHDYAMLKSDLTVVYLVGFQNFRRHFGSR